MRRFIRRPSPAMVVASIALFMAMGGVSYGLATGAIDSREIKNNTVRGKDVHNGSLTGRDVKRDGLGGLSISEGTLGTVPAADTLSHSAVVSSSGQLIRGRGTSSAARTSTGRYQVIFNRDVRGCVYVATVGDTSAAGPPAGTASVTSLGSNVNGVAIRTVDYGGSGDVLANKPFHLIVSC
jgi:hypothetical protein